MRLQVALVLVLAVTTPVRADDPVLKRPPTPRLPEFTGPESPWPPHPKRVLPGRPAIEGYKLLPSLTPRQEAELQQVAERDARVRAQLGDRYAFIAVLEVEPPKGERRGPEADIEFFSHTHNVAVIARMRGSTVQRVARRPQGFSPEGADEVRRAIEMARRDPRLAGRVEGLHADATLFFPACGEPGFGHRVLYVMFMKDTGEPVLYYAMVDLVKDQVLMAGQYARAGETS